MLIFPLNSGPLCSATPNDPSFPLTSPERSPYCGCPKHAPSLPSNARAEGLARCHPVSKVNWGRMKPLAPLSPLPPCLKASGTSALLPIFHSWPPWTQQPPSFPSGWLRIMGAGIPIRDRDPVECVAVLVSSLSLSPGRITFRAEGLFMWCWATRPVISTPWCPRWSSPTFWQRSAFRCAAPVSPGPAPPPGCPLPHLLMHLLRPPSLGPPATPPDTAPPLNSMSQN